jgi:replicative DNA helicase
MVMEAKAGGPIDPSRITHARELPHNLDAEMAILGALLVDNRTLDRLDGVMEVADFYDPLHRTIYAEIEAAVASGRAASPLTLKTVFQTAPPLSPTLTVSGYLVKLAAQAGNLYHITDHARLVHDLAQRRELIMAMDEALAVAYDPPSEVTANTQIETLESKLLQIAETGRTVTAEVSFEITIGAAVEMANKAYQRRGSLAGLSTGFIDLDAKLGGLQASDLIILAGRPSMGKTALVTNIARHNAQRRWLAQNRRDGSGADVDDGAATLFFSLEMSKEQLGLRILSEVSGVSSERYRRGIATDEEMERLFRVEQDINQWPLFVDETGGLTLAKLQARARRCCRQHPIGLIVIDYLQLLSGSGQENRVQEITAITTGLKALAKELRVPIIALSQLSRQVEARENKRPQLSDLRESGSIEQDADVVMFCFREEYYVERARPSPNDLDATVDWEQKMRGVAGRAEVIIGKQRHGPTGTVEMAWDGELTRFSNLAREGAR